MTSHNEQEPTEYGLVLPFDTDDPEFTRGFEAGQLWERLERVGRADQLLHAENAEMLMRIAESKHMEFRAEDLGDGWLHVIVEPAWQPAR
jgi:hypothetical protein